MKRSRVATLSKTTNPDQIEHPAPRSPGLPGESGDPIAPLAAGKPRPERKEKIPESARLWGFVRQLSLEEALNGEASDGTTPSEPDTSLWWDVERHRFLVVSQDLVIDDLAPLQFVQFVRELRDVTNRILFKYERRQDGSTGRAHRVWS
jgi:hypothetical protein